jgi:hypothetical protein
VQAFAEALELALKAKEVAKKIEGLAIAQANAS